ncbi:MAG: hypothetical protein IKF82_01190 [Bacilli bacterium]|nr:hypothetical protein [Bacilli bacterium]
MANPFNTQNTNPNFQLQNMYKMLTQSKNPMQLFQQMAMNNPRMQPIVDMLRSNSPETVFNTLCKQRGIDPQQFLKSITG